jgi:hypothetical protein
VILDAADGCVGRVGAIAGICRGGIKGAGGAAEDSVGDDAIAKGN